MTLLDATRMGLRASGIDASDERIMRALAMTDDDLRACDWCGMRAQPMGSEARCAEHDSERSER